MKSNTQRNPLQKEQGKDNTNHTQKQQLKPKFPPLAPEVIKDHFQGLKATSKFPVHAFPKSIQSIITETNRCLNFPIDFTGAAMLYATSIAIGNTHWVKVKEGWNQTAVLYLALIGSPGTNKSHPLNWAIAVFFERDRIAFEKYEQERDAYDEAVNDRENKSKLKKPKKPKWFQYIVQDATPEALTDIHQYNQRGIGMFSDELIGWLRDFGRYNKSGEESRWLSNWSGLPWRVNRATKEPSLIQNPFISVAGTMQPGVLPEFAQGRSENGFMDRILFAYPEGLKREYLSEIELSPEIAKSWHTILSNIIDLRMDFNDGRIESTKLNFSEPAHKLFKDYHRNLTDQINKTPSNSIKQMLSKFDMQTVRLSLCLQMLRYGCGNESIHEIGIEAMEGAILLAEYFKEAAIRVQESISADPDPVAKLHIDKQNLYDKLPESFKTSEGVNMAISLGIPDRTFRRMLQNKDLFKNIRHGEYGKLL